MGGTERETGPLAWWRALAAATPRQGVDGGNAHGAGHGRSTCSLLRGRLALPRAPAGPLAGALLRLRMAQCTGQAGTWRARRFARSVAASLFLTSRPGRCA
jgi:hypothetical protein